MTCSTPTDRLVQSVLTRVPGVTEELVSVELFNTVDEFFRRTSAWQHRTEIQLEEGKTEYSLSLPESGTFVRMLGVTLNALPVPAVQELPGEIQSSVGSISSEMVFPDGDARFLPTILEPPTGVFTYAIFRPTFIVVTPPTPEQVTQPFVAFVILSIAPGCAECDCGDWGLEDWMYDMYFQNWLDGVLMKLFSMPNKPWANKEAALFHGRRFRTAMGYRMQEARRGFNYGLPGWRYPRTGGWVR